jgi:hypothetical protein
MQVKLVVLAVERKGQVTGETRTTNERPAPVPRLSTTAQVERIEEKTVFGNEDRIQVMFDDQPISVRVHQVQARRSSPMTDEPNGLFSRLFRCR